MFLSLAKLSFLITNKKQTYRCHSARAFGCKPLFSWGLLRKIGFWGHLGGQKWHHRIARPRFAILPWNHLNISNRLGAVSVSLLGVYRGGLPPKIGVWGHLGGQKWHHRIARTRFAKTPCDRLAAVSVSLFSWGSAPKIGVWGALRGAEVTPSDSPPSIC